MAARAQPGGGRRTIGRTHSARGNRAGATRPGRKGPAAVAPAKAAPRSESSWSPMMTRTGWCEVLDAACMSMARSVRCARRVRSSTPLLRWAVPWPLSSRPGVPVPGRNELGWRVPVRRPNGRDRNSDFAQQTRAVYRRAGSNGKCGIWAMFHVEQMCYGTRQARGSRGCSTWNTPVFTLQDIGMPHRSRWLCQMRC